MKCPECGEELNRTDGEWGDVRWECFNCGWLLIE